jgi:hypothetical protein
MSFWDGGAEDDAKGKGGVLFDDGSGSDFRYQTQHRTDFAGTPYENSYDFTWKDTQDNPLFAYQHGGADPRDYMYGRTPFGADEAVNKAWGTGDAAVQSGQQAAAAGNDVAYGGRQLLQQRTGDAAYFDSRDTGKPWAQYVAGLEQQEGPSAAQAQLQAGTDKAMASQLALARSGRGFGSNAASMGQAQTNLATLDANQATGSAQLRAQENADWRRRQAGNVLNANNQLLQSQSQNDAMVQGMTGLGQQAYFQGAGVQQQGYGNANAGYQTSVGAQNTGNQIRGTQADLGKSYEDNQLRAWAAANGYNLQEQQRDDQNTSAYVAGAAALISAMSDVRAKTNIRGDEGAGSDFGRGLYFDGTIERPKEMGGYDPTERQGFHSATARPAYAEAQVSAATPMQQQFFGADDFPRPELRPPDTDALDAAAQDAVRKAPGSFYDYKDPGAPGANDRRNYGPMAQDLAATPAGSTAVVKRPDGKLGVDTQRLSLVNTGALSAQQKQLDEMSAQLDALNARTKRDDFVPEFKTDYGFARERPRQAAEY